MAGRLAAVAVLASLLALAGCALEREPVIRPTPFDGGPPDAPAPIDAGPTDAGPDTGPIDAGPTDAGPDAGPIDAGTDAGLDAGSGDAGPPDAGPPDAGRPDAGPPDAGPPDAGPPDAGPPDAGTTARDAGPDAPARTCNDVYGSLPGYQACASLSTPTTCRFYLNPSGNTSCATHCEAAAGTTGVCNEAYNEGTPVCSHSSTGQGCTSTHMDMVCDCDLVP